MSTLGHIIYAAALLAGSTVGLPQEGEVPDPRLGCPPRRIESRNMVIDATTEEKRQNLGLEHLESQVCWLEHEPLIAREDAVRLRQTINDGGTVEFSFQFDVRNDGYPENLRLVRPSGYPTVDAYHIGKQRDLILMQLRLPEAFRHLSNHRVDFQVSLRGLRFRLEGDASSDKAAAAIAQRDSARRRTEIERLRLTHDTRYREAIALGHESRTVFLAANFTWYVLRSGAWLDT